MESAPTLAISPWVSDPGAGFDRPARAGGGDDPAPEVARRHRDLVEEAPRDRRGPS
jgi:hypothetical protein